MSSIIRLNDIIKDFPQKRVLDKVSLSVEEGEYISIMGSSGSGKSTLLNIIGTLDSNFMGEYYFRDVCLKRSEYDSFRNRNIGFIFQAFNLLPGFTAKENALLPYAFYRGNINEIEEKVSEYFTMFGMREQYNQLTNTLSGGEKQRIALIRSLLLDPPIILADEPTGNLDDTNSQLVCDFLKQQHINGKTIIMVTHDYQIAKSADRVLKIYEGNIYE